MLYRKIGRTAGKAWQPFGGDGGQSHRVRSQLLGSFIEAYVGSLGKEAETEAHFGKMAQAALELARSSFATVPEDHNWYKHFHLLMQHPVIKVGVQIAAWHHYRLPEDLFST